MSERELIEFFLEKFQPKSSPIPLGDDVSALPAGKGRLVVFKVDTFTGRFNILPGMKIKQAARKALVAAISDFAAKGVKPSAALIGLGLPREMLDRVGELAEGLKLASKSYCVEIFGGDLDEAEDLTISVFLVGFCNRRNIVLRSGAKPGDLLAVTGNFGLTGSAFKILLEGFEAPEKLKRKILRSVYLPRVKLDIGLKLRKLGATASIDSSDGLAWSLHELSKASRVGFKITRLPAAPKARAYARLHNLDLFELVFYGGEEYEIVATFDPKTLNRADSRLRKKIKVIGVVTREEKIVFESRSLKRTVEPLGWEHFK
jgi:thiamine-monophosphate kinase